MAQVTYWARSLSAAEGCPMQCRMLTHQMPRAPAPSSWDHQKMSPDIARYLLGAICSWLKTTALRDCVSRSLNPNTEGHALRFSLPVGQWLGMIGWSPVRRTGSVFRTPALKYKLAQWKCQRIFLKNKKTSCQFLSRHRSTLRRQHDSGIMISFCTDMLYGV